MLCTALNGRGVHTDLELKRLRAITKPQKCLSLRSLKDFGTEIFTKDSTGGVDSNMIYTLLRFLYSRTNREGLKGLKDIAPAPKIG